MGLLRELAEQAARGHGRHPRDQEPRPCRQGLRDGPGRRAVLPRHARRRAKRFFGGRPTTTSTRRSTTRPATEWRARVRGTARVDRRGRPRAGADRAVRDRRGAAAAAATSAPGGAAHPPLREAVHARPPQPAILLGQVPVLALGDRAAVQGGGVRDRRCDPGKAAQAPVPASSRPRSGSGAIDSAREIIKERALMSASPRSGCSLSAYLVSKAVVLFTLVAVQARPAGRDRASASGRCTSRATRLRRACRDPAC